MVGSDLSFLVGSPFAAAEMPIHGSSVDMESAGHHVKEISDNAIASWESAWIDLGGEG